MRPIGVCGAPPYGLSLRGKTTVRRQYVRHDRSGRRSADSSPRSPARKSQELLARKTAAVAHGVGVTLPVFVARAGGGVLEDVDGNSLIDFGSGIAVTSVGNSAEAVVRRASAQLADFTHTCFMVTPYEGYVEVVRGARTS